MLRSFDADELRALLDALPLATGAKDGASRFLYVNAAASAGYGRTPAEMIGQTERDMLPPGNDIEAVLAAEQQALRSVRPLTVPGYRFTTFEGREMILHMTREPVTLAVEAARNAGTIDAVLLDLSLPGFAIEDVFRRLREVLPDAGILSTSGYSEPSVLRSLLQRPAHALLQKPFSASELATQIRALFPSTR